MPKSFKLTIEYDGTDYSGWQRQQDRTTIQGELESVLSLILNQEIKIAGSGRTDAGVHAHVDLSRLYETRVIRDFAEIPAFAVEVDLGTVYPVIPDRQRLQHVSGFLDVGFRVMAH